MQIGRLHILTDTRLQQRFDHAELARLACAGGADVIQFRQKEGSVRERLGALKGVADVCSDANVSLIVNDQLDLALAVEADGIHLGQEDLPIEAVRQILDLQDGPTLIIGATCTTLEQADRAVREGADYIGFGPVYETKSKANPALVKGLDGLAEVCRAIPIPVIAIGGITVERVQSVLDTGAHGIAVLSAVTMAPDPQQAATQFRAEIDRLVG